MTDGKVFDRISVVAERYGKGKRKSPIEIFRFERQIKAMPAGGRLRILANDQFYLVYTLDDWTTVRTADSRHLGCAGHVADIETESGKPGRLIFTFKWRQSNRWEGRNFEVRLDLANEEMTIEQQMAGALASS